MPKTKRVPLGKPLPPVASVPAPTDEQLNILSALWDRLVPAYAGLLDTKPLGGGVKAKFYRDEIKGITIRASTGRIVTRKEQRKAFLLFQKGMKM